MHLFLCVLLLLRSFLYLWFPQEFDFVTPIFRFCCIYPSWPSLNFLYLWLEVFHQFWKSLYNCLFIFLLAHSLSPPETSIKCLLDNLILSHRSWDLCFIFFFPLFSFYIWIWITSSHLLCPSAVKILNKLICDILFSFVRFSFDSFL